MRLRVREVVVVEGRYDAAAVADVIDGLVLTTDGFSIFRDDEKKDLLRRLGKQRGLLILTDSDAAGFKIRHYIEKIAAGCTVRHAYIPAVAGKESRKTAPSKEGILGVEGMPQEVLAKALQNAGVQTAAPKTGRALTHTDLYTLGISGTAGSAARRRAALHRLGLPGRLSKKAMLEVLNSLYSYEELMDLMREKPVVFWDFHGTLTTYDENWMQGALFAARKYVPGTALERDVLEANLSANCLPWFTVPSRDTRHLTADGAWWGHCEGQFVQMYMRCGLSREEAEKAAPGIREFVLDAANYTLRPDAVGTLEALRQRGYKSYILSNNFPELSDIIEKLGLAPLLAGVITSANVGYDKPRREIFDYALEYAGDPAAAVMVGDNPNDDTGGAKAAGLTAVAAFRQAPEADYNISALSEILDILP